MKYVLNLLQLLTLVVVVAAFGLRASIPDGYMLGLNETGDSIIIELCSSTDTKFVRLNLETGETETVDPNAPEHSDDESPLSQDGAVCSLASHIDLFQTPDLDWPIEKRFARVQAVTFLKRTVLAARACLPSLPARGPPSLA